MVIYERHLLYHLDAIKMASFLSAFNLCSYLCARSDYREEEVDAYHKAYDTDYSIARRPQEGLLQLNNTPPQKLYRHEGNF